LALAVAVTAQTPKTTKDKVYSTEQAARGEKQYAAVCASCHDPAKVPAGKKPAPPLVGEKFLDKWQSRTLGELLTNIQTTMPNDGSAVLSEAETADVVAYMLKANGFPDGPAALKYGAPSKDIVIVK
jgi:mono/diheme cytochrome c family protein